MPPDQNIVHETPLCYLKREILFYIEKKMSSVGYVRKNSSSDLKKQ